MTDLTLDNLVIEKLSPRDQNNRKKLFTYDQSLFDLRSRGYERHLRPDEAFRIIIDAIENPNSQYILLKQDMLFSYGEWFSLAVQRANQTELILYPDPKNLVWNDEKGYLMKGKSSDCSEAKTFTIDQNIPSQNWLDLNRFPNELVEFLCSRPFDRLPEIMKSGNNRSQLWLPQEGIIRPFGRGDDFYDFNLGAYCNYWASRGVRLRAP